MANELFYEKLNRYQKSYEQIIIDYSMGISFQQVKHQIYDQKYEAFYNQKKQEYLARVGLKRSEDWKIDDDTYGIPVMNQVFYHIMKNCRRIPKWKEFLSEYKRIHCVNMGNGYMRLKDQSRGRNYVFQEYSLDYKLLRGYMSFLKEVYVLFWFYDKNFIMPYYSLHMDLCGYDIIVRNMFDRLYGIRIYANTKKAQEFVEAKKNGRSAVPQESTCISFVSQINGNGTKLGDTYVFSDQAISDMMYYINNNNTSDTIILG